VMTYGIFLCMLHLCD